MQQCRQGSPNTQLAASLTHLKCARSNCLVHSATNCMQLAASSGLQQCAECCPAPCAGSPRAASVSGGHGMTFNPMHGTAQPHAQPGPSPLSSEAPPSAARETLGPATGQVRTGGACGPHLAQVKRIRSRGSYIDQYAPRQARSNCVGNLGAGSCRRVSLNDA